MSSNSSARTRSENRRNHSPTKATVKIVRCERLEVIVKAESYALRARGVYGKGVEWTETKTRKAECLYVAHPTLSFRNHFAKLARKLAEKKGWEVPKCKVDSELDGCPWFTGDTFATNTAVESLRDLVATLRERVEGL